MCEQFENSEQISVTLDIWTDRQMRAFLGVTDHYIENFELKNTVLACRRFSGSHTGENILNQFEDILDSFSIKDKVHIAVTDNASNMKKVFRLIEEINSTSPEARDDDYIEPVPVSREDTMFLPCRQSCFAHTLQLVVKYGFQAADQINKMLAKLSKLLNHVHHSSHATDLVEGELKFQMANATRWNSQLTMLKSFLCISPPALQTLYYDEKLNSYETNIAKDMVEILATFQ